MLFCVLSKSASISSDSSEESFYKLTASIVQKPPPAADCNPAQSIFRLSASIKCKKILNPLHVAEQIEDSKDTIHSIFENHPDSILASALPQMACRPYILKRKPVCCLPAMCNARACRSYQRRARCQSADCRLRSSARGCNS